MSSFILGLCGLCLLFINLLYRQESFSHSPGVWRVAPFWLCYNKHHADEPTYITVESLFKSMLISLKQFIEEQLRH